MSARRLFFRRNLLLLGGLLWACALAAPVGADTTVPQYDPNGNTLFRTTSRGTASYTYDASDRLKTEFGPGVNQAFGYDPNSNRQSDGTNSYTIAPNSNRIQTVNGITQVYDPAGNLLNDGQGKTYTYNAAGRLKEVRVNAVLVATYKYNYRGLRTHKITPQGTTLYHYDIQGHLIQTTDPLGVPKQSLHWADDQPIAQVDHTATNQLVYLHTDALNTPRSATDANRTIVWRWEGGAFGDTPPEGDPDNNGITTTINLRYPGQLYDSESGLFYNWNRYYDPKNGGRYITSDPIGLDGGLNTYTYVRNNPLSLVDPLGLRDIVAVVWERQVTDSSVGHVLLAEMAGKIISSSFPYPQGTYGFNTTKSWAETLSAEGRKPTGIFKVFVPDDDAFDTAAGLEKLRERWDWNPEGAYETNCTVASYRSLAAGKLKLSKPWVKPWSPDDFLDEMNRLAALPKSGVSRLSSVPWK